MTETVGPIGKKSRGEAGYGNAGAGQEEKEKKIKPGYKKNPVGGGREAAKTKRAENRARGRAERRLISNLFSDLLFLSL